MAQRVAVTLFLVLATVLLAGCTDGNVLKEYERPAGDTEDEDLFTFTIPKGTDRVTFIASTEGSPSSTGAVEFVVAQQFGSSPLYMVRLGHGQEDKATVDDPPPGQYYGIVEYDDGYTGPASLKVSERGGGALFSIGGSFWDIAGVTLALLTLIGGYLLYRRHSSRLNREMERIDETFRELRADVEACRLELHDMQEDLHRQLVQGRLKESHYLILEKRIERYLADLDRSPLPSKRAAPEPDVPLEFE